MASSTPPIRRLYQLLLPERQDLLTVFLFAVLSGVLYLATPLAVDALVNSLAFGASEGVYVQALVVLSLGLFGFLLLLGLVRAAQYFVTELIQRRLFVRLTADLAYRLPRVEMRSLEQKLGPDLVNRFFDVVTVQKSGSLLLLDGINLVLGAFFGLLILGFYHPFLLLFAFVLLGYLVIVLVPLGRGAVTTSIEESYAKHDVASWLEQVALFPYLFKANGACELAERRADELAHGYLDARGRHWQVVFRQIVSLLGLQAIASAALLGLGGFLVLNAELTLGQLVAAEIIVSAIVANLASLGKHMEAFYDALAAVDKIGYVVDLPIERSGGERTDWAPGSPQEISVEGLRFGYDDTRPVFEDVTFLIEPGERVALVGPKGSGTSTLMNILIGTHMPQAGAAKVGGIDVRDWELHALRRGVALVRGQEIVEGTVLENVRVGRDEITRQQVRDALRDVGLLDDVVRLPEGLDAELMFGGRPLSDSQRSRLVLARAIVGKPGVLLLDEHLENLEPQTASELTDFVFDRSNPWTLVVASHETAVLQRCDRRIDMSDFGSVRTGVTGD
jgi:ABC-type bacteriocin/lantibiotic exporter with double-glycine peptidase domain